MNLVPAIDCLGKKEPFLIRRPGQGSYTKGHWIRPDAEEFEGTGAIFPASEETIQMLPEGVRSRETKEVFTACELFTADAKTNREADILVLRDIDFEVHMIWDWREAGGFFHAVCVKMDQ